MVGRDARPLRTPARAVRELGRPEASPSESRLNLLANFFPATNNLRRLHLDVLSIAA